MYDEHEIKIYALDDDPDALKLMKLYCDRSSIKNFFVFSDIQTMIDAIDQSSQVFILDYHLPNYVTGDMAAKVIKQKKPICEIIFISAQLTPDEYENLINNYGATKFARKDDMNKLGELIRQAIENVNRKIRHVIELQEFFEQRKMKNKEILDLINDLN